MLWSWQRGQRLNVLPVVPAVYFMAFVTVNYAKLGTFNNIQYKQHKTICNLWPACGKLAQNLNNLNNNNNTRATSPGAFKGRDDPTVFTKSFVATGGLDNAQRITVKGSRYEPMKWAQRRTHLFSRCKLFPTLSFHRQPCENYNFESLADNDLDVDDAMSVHEHSQMVAYIERVHVLRVR